MTREEYIRTKAELANIDDALSEGHLTPEERAELRALSVALSQQLVTPWIPAGWVRRGMMLTLAAVIKEIEAMGGPLWQKFDLVYGTSTGAIIAALVCLGYAVDDILALYREHVVKVMRSLLPGKKTAALEALSAEVFKDQDFSAFKTDIGIVCTDWDSERPKIFKTSKHQAYRQAESFVPGFGCKIGEAAEQDDRGQADRR